MSCPFPAFPTGPQAFGWFKRPIKDLADFKGMKCRQTGINAEVFTEMGMRTVNLPGGEIIPAAERGVIDCAEWVGGIEDLRLGFHTVWKYHYTPGMHEPVTMGELLINTEVWEKLSPVHKEIIKSAIAEAMFRWYAKWQRQNADALKEFLGKHKVNVLKTPTRSSSSSSRPGTGSPHARRRRIPSSRRCWSRRGSTRGSSCRPNGSFPPLRVRRQPLLAGEEVASGSPVAAGGGRLRPLRTCCGTVARLARSDAILTWLTRQRRDPTLATLDS